MLLDHDYGLSYAEYGESYSYGSGLGYGYYGYDYGLGGGGSCHVTHDRLTLLELLAYADLS